MLFYSYPLIPVKIYFEDNLKKKNEINIRFRGKLHLLLSIQIPHQVRDDQVKVNLSVLILTATRNKSPSAILLNRVRPLLGLFLCHQLLLVPKLQLGQRNPEVPASILFKNSPFFPNQRFCVQLKKQKLSNQLLDWNKLEPHVDHSTRLLCYSVTL